MISLARLERVLATLPTLSIGLVGDLFLDRYLDIDPELAVKSRSKRGSKRIKSREYAIIPARSGP